MGGDFHDTSTLMYRILHTCFSIQDSSNILFLNERLFKCNLSNTKLCCLCGLVSETPEDLFSTCKVTKTLWTALQNKLNTSINLGPLTPQSAIQGFTEKCDDFYIKNHWYSKLSFTSTAINSQLLHTFKAVAELEIASCEAAKRAFCVEKWENNRKYKSNQRI